ncbi:MAG: hypothetical protein MK080_13105 [Opitutales bacterium]|nr:hypothetical protein [Opitutales bacterium]NRA28445.1 hypothetical protein [Opitutales bacterium]
MDPLSASHNDDLHISIRFENESLAPIAVGESGNNSATFPSDNDYVTMRDELINTQGYLESTIEEFETSNESLQNTNEELLTANEELRVQLKGRGVFPVVAPLLQWL